MADAGSVRAPNGPLDRCARAVEPGPLHMAWSKRYCVGIPNGIRTRAAALKGRCPRPLDDGDRRNLSDSTERQAIKPPRSSELSDPFGRVRGGADGAGS